jgi:hypothetical protein
MLDKRKHPNARSENKRDWNGEASHRRINPAATDRKSAKADYKAANGGLTVV